MIILFEFSDPIEGEVKSQCSYLSIDKGVDLFIIDCDISNILMCSILIVTDWLC